MIRSIRPTDLAALLTFARKGFPNLAKTGRDLGQRDKHFSLGNFLEQWLSLGENRHTWVDISRGQIRGLVSVRSRPSIAWQIDRLVLPEEGGEDLCLSLLEYVGAVGGEVGAQKVFLRLERASGLVEVAQQAGFFTYRTEFLYWRPSLAEMPSSDLPPDLRAKRPGDDLALFHLYSSVVPSYVRQAEAMTFEEWRAIRMTSLGLRMGRELVRERDGVVIGWLQMSPGGEANSFDILAPAGDGETLEALLRCCLHHLAWQRPTFCLVSEYWEGLRRLLEEYGFQVAGEYCSQVKQLAVRIRQPGFAPARV
jgi:hypothetical protein